MDVGEEGKTEEAIDPTAAPMYVGTRSAAVPDFKSCRRVLTEIMLDEYNDRHPSYYPKSV